MSRKERNKENKGLAVVPNDRMDDEGLTGDSESEDSLNSFIVPIEEDAVNGPLRKKVIDTKDTMDKARWNLAEFLSIMNDGKLFQQFGYPTWDKYINGEVKIHVRTSTYLCTMFLFYTGILAPKLDEEDRAPMIERVRGLGWKKACSLVDVCDENNYKEWIDKAEKLTAEELTSETKKILVARAGGDPDQVSTSKTFSAKLDEGEREMVVEALDHAGRTLNSKNKGQQLAMICQQYVADNAAKNHVKGEELVRTFMRLGAVFGLDLVAIEPGTNKVVVGQDVLNRIVK